MSEHPPTSSATQAGPASEAGPQTGGHFSEGPPPGAGAEALETDAPARLDRLPWGRFHWLLITALGVTWVLDGLEATIVASIGSTLLLPRPSA
jgi:hypothetical protein